MQQKKQLLNKGFLILLLLDQIINNNENITVAGNRVFEINMKFCLAAKKGMFLFTTDDFKFMNYIYAPPSPHQY